MIKKSFKDCLKTTETEKTQVELARKLKVRFYIPVCCSL